MKLKIDRTYLLEGLKKVQGAVATKTPHECLKYTKVIFHDEGIVLIGSNSDLSLRYFLPFEVNGTEMMQLDLEKATEISILVDARPIIQTLSKVKQNTVEFTLLDQQPPYRQLQMKIGRSKTILSLLDATLYPKFSFELNESHFNLNSETFKQMVHGGGYAVAHTESRPILTGVHFILKDNHLIMESTDSFYAARYDYELDVFQEMNEESLDVTLEHQAISILLGLLPKEEVELIFSFQENQILIQFGNLTILSRLLSGIYPNMDSLINIGSRMSFACELDMLYDLTDRLHAISKFDDGLNSNALILEVTPDAMNEVKFSIGTGALKTEDYLSVGQTKGFSQPFKIGFNPVFLLNGLKSLKTNGVETIKVGFNGEMMPFYLRNEEDSLHHTALIVPLRLA